MSAAGWVFSVPALAGDLNVTTAVTTPVKTSTADGVSPGNVTVQSTGSISVTTAGGAVTIDSSNTVSNAGTISNAAEANATGILASTTGTLVSGITNSGTINLAGPASTSANFPAFVNNAGISVVGSGIFQGSITTTSTSNITVGGNGATGINIAGTTNGTITNGGTIKIVRQGSYGIKSTAAVSGNIVNTGTIDLAAAQEGIGIYANNVAGSIINSGTVKSGRLASTDSTNNNATIPAVRGGQAMWVAGNVGGILLNGNGVINANEEAAGVKDADSPDSLLWSVGGADALLIGPGGVGGNNNVTISGLTPGGSSLVLRGDITAQSLKTATRAVNITGATVNGTQYRTNFTGAFENQGGNIGAAASDATAVAVRIGGLATVPTLINSGEILARGLDSLESEAGAVGGGGGDAYGIVVEANGSLTSIVNSGIITADSHGGTQSGYGIVDYSGTLRSITNTGTIQAAAKGFGGTYAFDLTRTTAGVQVTNGGAGVISGSMLFGSGDDQFTSTGGSLQGFISMGAGNDTLSFTNTSIIGDILLGDGAHTVSFVGGTLIGGITLGTGTANLDVSASTFDISTLTGVTVTQARFRDNSTLKFTINTDLGTVGTLKATNVVIDNGTTIQATIVGPVLQTYTANLIEATSLTLNADLSAQQPASTVMYNRSIARASDNPNILQYRITRRTASQIGFTGNTAVIYENSVEAMGLDTSLGPVLAAYQNKSDLDKALTALVPDLTSDTRTTALTVREATQSALRRRMSGFLGDKRNQLSDYRPSVWVQQYDTFGTDNGQGAIPGFRVSSYGIATGADADIGDQSMIGLSLSHTRMNTEEKNSPDKSIGMTSTGFDFYGRWNAGDIGYIQGNFGVGYDKYSRHRVVTVDTVTREPIGQSSGNQWGGAVEAGTSYRVGESTTVGAFVRGSYLDVYEHTYAEDKGGEGINLRYHSRENVSARAAVGASVDQYFEIGSWLLQVGARGQYAHEFDTSATTVTAQFAAAGSLFTLTGAKPATSIYNAGIGAALMLRNDIISLDYDMQRQGSYRGNNVSLTYRHRF